MTFFQYASDNRRSILVSKFVDDLASMLNFYLTLKLEQRDGNPFLYKKWALKLQLEELQLVKQVDLLVASEQRLTFTKYNNFQRCCASS